MLALWILLAVVALIGLLLSAPIHMRISYSPEEGFQYRVKYLLISLADSRKPEKPKKPTEKRAAKEKKKPEKSSKNAAAALLSFLGLEDISSAANAKRAISENGLLETLGNVASALKALFSRIAKLAGKGVFRRFDLRITVADTDAADAALRYGTVCAAVYPLIALLDGAMTFRNRNVEIRFDESKTTTDARFDGDLFYRPYHILSFGCGLVWRYIKQSIKKEGKTDE